MPAHFNSSQKHERKAAAKPSPKLQNFGHRNRCEQIHHAPGVEGHSGGKALPGAASSGAYGQPCGHEGLKIQENPPGYGIILNKYFLFESLYCNLPNPIYQFKSHVLVF